MSHSYRPQPVDLVPYLFTDFDNHLHLHTPRARLWSLCHTVPVPVPQQSVAPSFLIFSLPLLLFAPPRRWDSRNSPRPSPFTQRRPAGVLFCTPNSSDSINIKLVAW